MLSKWMFTLGLMLGLALGCSSAAELVTLVQADGEEVTGMLKEINAESATVETRKFAAREIAQIKFRVVPAPGAPTAPSVILRNQDVIAQTAIVSGSDTAITLKSAWNESIVLEYKVIDAIVFYATSKKMPDALEALLKSAPLKEDALLTLKGETISGFYEKLNDKTITFNAGGQSKAYPFDQIAAVRLAATEKFDMNKALNTTVILADGSRLTVKPLEAETRFLKVEALDA